MASVSGMHVSAEILCNFVSRVERTGNSVLSEQAVSLYYHRLPTDGTNDNKLFPYITIDYQQT